MGIFSKLFGKKEPEQPHAPLNMEPTAEMLDEDRYWNLVQRSLEESGGDQECQQNVLVQALEDLTPTEIVGFRLRTDKLLYDTYTSEMWCAGYLINGGCSDDGFQYFRLWVISRGRAIYEAAKLDPDALSQHLDDNMGQYYDFEPFWYVALTAFEKKTGQNLYDYIDEGEFAYSESKYPNFEFTWTEEDPDSMKKICPRLFQRFDVSANEL